MGKAEDPLLGEGGPGKARDGCGAALRSDLVPPLFRPCGATFPQGNVEDPLLGEGLGSYFFVVLLVSSSVLPWMRASIRVREYSIWL